MLAREMARAALFLTLILLGVPALSACAAKPETAEPDAPRGASDPLPSWNEGSAKDTILEFVAGVTDAAGASYVPLAGRIAVFDNDGTLWTEKPVPVQAAFAVARVAQMAPDHPELVSFDNEAMKPANIQLHIGRRPILAAGNSDGDLQMLQYARAARRPCLALLLHHDDAEREYDYLAGAEEVMAVTEQNPWVIVGMQRDFATVFPVEAGE